MLYRLALIAALLLATVANAQNCMITMGYRTTDRLPYIAAEPDNSGLYLDLYTEASRRIGCKLNIARAPKNRILDSIKTGIYDFYPGLIYTPERAKDIYFAPNGLPSQQVAITRTGLPLFNDMQSMRGKTLIMAMGGPYKNASQYGIEVRSPPELEIDKGIELIIAGKGDIYIDDLSSLRFHLKDYPNKDKLMLHPNCCGGASYFTMGISRKSKHARFITNPQFDPNKDTSMNNEPFKLSADSVLGRFSRTILQLSQEGFTNKLYKQYYGNEMPTIQAIQ